MTTPDGSLDFEPTTGIAALECTPGMLWVMLAGLWLRARFSSRTSAPIR